jgi:hypothetical protein
MASRELGIDADRRDGMIDNVISVLPVLIIGTLVLLIIWFGSTKYDE